MSGSKVDFQSLEQLARENQWPLIESKIKSLDRKYFLTKDIVHLATMARRAYRLSTAVYLLTPLVLNPDNQVLENASPLALAEYAICHTMLGGRQKARELLERLPNQTEKEHFAWVTYYFSFADYKAATPHLQASIALEKDEYKLKLAQLNLSSCLIASEQYQEAEKTLNSLNAFFKQKEYTLLLSNTEELLGQLALRRDDVNLARQHLGRAQNLMAGNNKLYDLFIEKWLLVCDLKSSSTTFQQISPLIERAQSLGHYHTVREILFYWAFYGRNYELIQKIHFGTPFWSYRDFMFSQTGFKVDTPYYNWDGQLLNSPVDHYLTLNKTQLNGLKLSPQEIKLLAGLSQDFYEPRSVSALFYDVYPDEYFNPPYSTAKTYKLIQRLNKKLSKADVPVSISNRAERYSLRVENNWGLQVLNPDQNQSHDPSDRNIVQAFQARLFSRQDVMDRFQLSRSATLRWLGRLQQSGLILKVGQGPGSFYKIAS